MATQYKLVSFKACPWVQRAAIVLREKGAAFDFVHIEPGNRPDWFTAISPHGKVPVLRLDDTTSLFESNAIAEYLDETIEPRLAPADPVHRAINRAWTDWLPSFSAATGAVSTAADEQGLTVALEGLRQAFAKLEEALNQRPTAGPWFNGAGYGLVDAGYAPFLQRWRLLERFTGVAELAAFPLLDAWSEALVARSSTHSFPPEEFEALYRGNLAKRGGLLAGRLPQPA
ncbi:MAG TPA: glutathione S-transferase family protein [Novosphingobium sp.]